MSKGMHVLRIQKLRGAAVGHSKSIPDDSPSVVRYIKPRARCPGVLATSTRSVVGRSSSGNSTVAVGSSGTGPGSSGQDSAGTALGAGSCGQGARQPSRWPWPGAVEAAGGRASRPPASEGKAMVAESSLGERGPVRDAGGSSTRLQPPEPTLEATARARQSAAPRGSRALCGAPRRCNFSIMAALVPRRDDGGPPTTLASALLSGSSSVALLGRQRALVSVARSGETGRGRAQVSSRRSWRTLGWGVKGIG